MSAQSLPTTPALPEQNPLLQVFQTACTSEGIVIPEPANALANDSIFRTTAK